MDVLFGQSPAGDGHLDLHSNLHLDRAKRFVVTRELAVQSKLLPFFIIFIILIIVINLLVVIFILLSKAMRQSSRHLLVLSVCAGDLVMGFFVLPALLDLSLHSSSPASTSTGTYGSSTSSPVRSMDCSTFYAVRLFAELLVPSITTLAMLALNLDYILRLCCSAYSDGCCRTLTLLLLFLVPWVLSCCLLTPLYTQGLEVTKGIVFDSPWYDDSPCIVAMGGALTRTLLSVSFFPQAGLLLLFTLGISILYLARRESTSLDAMGERIRAPVDICLASFTTILFYTPVFLLNLLTSEGYLGCRDDDECAALGKLTMTAVWLMFAKSWFLPLAWFTCRDTRSCIRHIFSCW